MPTISIIVPVYRVEPYLHRCMDSILNQTYQDFELILVDDGSPDNCGAICDEYAATDSRIHVIHQENGGQATARNVGLDWMFANSDSQWLTFIDSDDWVHRDYLKILLTSVLEQDADISACNLTQTKGYCDDVEIEDQKATYLSPEQAHLQYYGYFVGPCGKLYRRELWRDVRFPVGKIYEDCFVTQIPLFLGKSIAICKISLYYYFANPDSTTRKQWSEKRLQEVEAHEVRLAWLEAHGYQEAIRRELKECVNVLFIHTETLANMCLEKNELCPQLEALRKKFRFYLQRARKEGMFPFEWELFWLYLLAFASFPVWRFAKGLQKIKWAVTEINSNA